jgi:hypothetical protein
MKSAIAVLAYQAAALVAVLTVPSVSAWATELFGLPLLILTLAGIGWGAFMTLRRPSMIGCRERMEAMHVGIRTVLDGPWRWGLPIRDAEPSTDEEARTVKRQAIQFFIAVGLAAAGLTAAMVADLLAALGAQPA